MAVVFISPKKRQRMFFLVITLMFVLFLVFVFLGVIFSAPKEVPPIVVLNTSKVNIDMTIFDSVKFKNLQAFPEMGDQYRYKATARNKTVQEGFIAADSATSAVQILQKMGFTNPSLQKVEAGRENPFIKYYTVPPPPAETTTTTTQTTTAADGSATPPPAGQNTVQ